ncbi:MAG TPA: hypothetical protein VE338_00990 [Ktedonobacterales bacterium]|jgi:hypothetical protein|nr:hypothetical protein [Ktedonobacterales bacterium]
MPLLIAALLALSAALIVLYPLLGLTREPALEQSTPTAPAADAAERERVARQALREVEFDYTLGNLETGDYEELRDRYETRALAALKARYQREQELDALIERQLDALRQSGADTQVTHAGTGKPSTSAGPQAAPAATRPAPQTRPSRVERARPASASVRERRAPKRKGS